MLIHDRKSVGNAAKLEALLFALALQIGSGGFGASQVCGTGPGVVCELS